MPSAIIVDDETNLISYLQDKLAVLWPELKIAGTAVNGRQALALADDCEPDIAFLDIHMPGLDGLQVAERLPSETKIVFVTAFDNHAIDAFERAAVDYLLKPVADARLQQTIERLRDTETSKRTEILALLETLNPQTTNYLQWLRTGLQETTELVSVDEVVYFQAEQKYVSVMTSNREHLVRMSIKELEKQLDPASFWQIHRGIIVRIDQIKQARRDLRGRYTLSLRDRPELIRSSAAYGHLFKQM